MADYRYTSLYNSDINSIHLTNEALRKAKGLHLYNENTLYVEMPGVYPYFRTYNGINWELSPKLDEYFESSLMMSYLRMLTPDEAIDLLNDWRDKYK